MIKLENIQVMNMENAIRGARNPLNSWGRMDSYYEDGIFVLGPNDLDLAKRLRKAGPDHRKYMRQIFVSMDITAPLYWWKEFDTYKVGTCSNSCSTMHTIHKKPFELSDFSFDSFEGHEIVLKLIITELNMYREHFVKTADKAFWLKMIQLVPSSFNQKRTITMTYENLVNMYHARKTHKLDEWRQFCHIVEDLPYAKELIIG